MKCLLVLLLAILGVVATSCEELTDPDDPASVKRAKDRAEYVILCKPQEQGGTVSYSLEKVLHLKAGAAIPWSLGGTVPGPALNPTSDCPDWAVMFFENVMGDPLPTEVQFFYTDSNESDGERLESLVNNLQQ